MKTDKRMKIFFWIFFGVCVAFIIGSAILNAVLAVYYVKGVFSADMPEWAKWALVTIAAS
jgi:hypothetical protein|nr:MAG TPA: Neurotransmitter-gated ion-channel transmembrane region [Caudoviricetes sp.]